MDASIESFIEGPRSPHLPPGTTVHERLIRKLTTIAVLSADEKEMLYSLPIKTRTVEGQRELIHDHDRADQCCLLVEGFMHRYKHLGNGRRQIISIHVPGDIPDLQSLHLPVTDHALGTLTSCMVGFIPHQALTGVIRDSPGLATAFWRDSLIEAATFREWLINVGARPGPQRIAHLFCELFFRLRSLGLADETGCEFPITQTIIGDAVGLSSVHVNRMMQELRGRGLIATRHHFLSIPNWKALQAFAGFDPTYLHVRNVDGP